MQARDLRDSTRTSAPLKPAPDAVEVDNTDMTIEETVHMIVSMAENKTFSIDSFRGKYDFLSNFYGAIVFYDGLWYRNSEAAFQSAKTLDTETRKRFAEVSPIQAKKMGRTVKLRPDWEQVKDGIMLEILRSKFGSASLRGIPGMTITGGSANVQSVTVKKDSIVWESCWRRFGTNFARRLNKKRNPALEITPGPGFFSSRTLKRVYLRGCMLRQSG